jgi:hypothetical protein
VVRVAESEELQPSTGRSELLQLGVEPTTATQRNHRDPLGLEIAAGTSGHRPDRQDIAHAFDQDRLSGKHREPA